MRILLIANYVPDAQQSMQRYAAVLRDGLTMAGHNVRVIRPDAIAGRLAPHRSAVKWFGYIDKLALFPEALRRALGWADVVHICDHSNAFYVKYLQAKPHVVTCHDLLAIRSALGEIPDRTTRWSGRQLQRMILDGLRNARNIVCVSEATRADLRRIAGDSDAQISRIYNGLNYPYEPMTVRDAAAHLSRAGLDSNRPFILHVGGNQWYKNRLGAMRIFAHLRSLSAARDLVLVMAGKPWTDEMRQFAKSHDFGRSAVELADATEEDLRALYSRAELLLFPSLEEGFGWPVAEAQACGCPVVTSNRAPMTEVGGSAAIYIDPLDHESAASVTAAALGSRKFTREANLRNAARFRASAMIDAYLALYEAVLTGKESRQRSVQLAS